MLEKQSELGRGMNWLPTSQRLNSLSGITTQYWPSASRLGLGSQTRGRGRQDYACPGLYIVTQRLREGCQDFCNKQLYLKTSGIYVTSHPEYTSCPTLEYFSKEVSNFTLVS